MVHAQAPIAASLLAPVKHSASHKTRHELRASFALGRSRIDSGGGSLPRRGRDWVRRFSYPCLFTGQIPRERCPIIGTLADPRYDRNGATGDRQRHTSVNRGRKPLGVVDWGLKLDDRVAGDSEERFLSMASVGHPSRHYARQSQNLARLRTSQPKSQGV